MKQIGENDKCIFYRTKRCEELEKMDENIQKHGEGIHFIRIIFKDPKENSDLWDTYLVVDQNSAPVAEVNERTEKGWKSLLNREINRLQEQELRRLLS